MNSPKDTLELVLGKSTQRKMRRAAEQAAFEGRQEIFKTQIEAVKKSNELLNGTAPVTHNVR